MRKKLFTRLSFVLVIIVTLLVFTSSIFAQGQSSQAFQRVMQVQQRNTARLMAMQNVEGTAIGLDGNGRLALKVFTSGPGASGVPRLIQGVPVQIVVTGRIYALKKPPWAGGPGDNEEEPTLSPTDSWPRPVPVGVSTGNANEIAAGTIGCRVTDGTNVYALSNNHVYAMENDAPPLSVILQPGLYDLAGYSYTQNDILGNLAAFIPISFGGGINYVDAAIALTSVNKLDNATPSDGYGIPKSTTQAAVINLPVKKYGRTTGFTKGKVYAVNATIDIYYYYHNDPATFAGQIIITPGTFSASGDSGSLIVADGRGKNKKDDRKPVGLLFAGNDFFTIANPIDWVLDDLAESIGVSELWIDDSQ